MQLDMPDIIFLAGEKRSGKGMIASALAMAFDYKVVHIAEAWVRKHLEAMGVTWAEYQMNKAKYRPEIQRRAQAARDENPDCLIEPLDADLDLRRDYGQKVVVDGVRFINEAQYGRNIGAFTLRVVTPREVRAERFKATGEDLALLDDPFESEIPRLPVHADIPGVLPLTVIAGAVWYLAQEYHRPETVVRA